LIELVSTLVSRFVGITASAKILEMPV